MAGQYQTGRTESDYLFQYASQCWRDCTHCLPPVAGSSTYLSKYNRTSLSLSSGPGRAKFTISSMRSFMAQSNCSGWLLANTSINLQKKKPLRDMLGSRQVGTDKAKYSLRLQHGYGLHFAQNISECLLVALFSSAIQECIQSSSEVFTDLLLQKKKTWQRFWFMYLEDNETAWKNLFNGFLGNETCRLTVDLLRRNASASSTNNRSL